MFPPNQDNKPRLHPDDTGDTTDPPAPLDVAGDADDRLREIELQGRLDEQKAELEMMKAEIDTLRGGTTQGDSIGDTDDIYADDPAMKKLDAIEKRLDEKLDTITSSMATITTEVENSKEAKSRDIVEDHAQKWIDGVISQDTALSANPDAAKILKQEVTTWVRDKFNPKHHLEQQFQVFKKGVQDWLNRYGPMVAAGAKPDADKAASAGKPDARRDALERDKHARDSIAAEGTSPPSVTDQKILTRAGDLYSEYMSEYEAQTSS